MINEKIKTSMQCGAAPSAGQGSELHELCFSSKRSRIDASIDTYVSIGQRTIPLSEYRAFLFISSASDNISSLTQQKTHFSFGQRREKGFSFEGKQKATKQGDKTVKQG